MDESRLSPLGKALLQRIEFDPDEQLVTEIRKHPIGLVIIYASGLSITVLLFLLLVVAPALITSPDALGLGIDITAIRPILVLVGFFMTVLSLIATAIAAYLYVNNVVIVTSEKIAQVLYRTIFDRKISQLSIGDVQDVTVSQRGLLSHIFNYGTLVIETAGEQNNYDFTYTPQPYEAAKAIVGAHERNLVQYGN
ncbi:MAG: hypothetical protein JWL85_471 [Candidatus Saccharibacteria bacterium]|nr:hypothetical protein [Candidatus Saccharibacteria bacterium]